MLMKDKTMNNTTNGKKKTWWRKAIYFIGIDTIYTNRWSMNLRPLFFIIVLLVIGSFIVSMLGFAKFSASPTFCNSCHIMEPYYDAWSNSKHSHVDCVTCHYPPGTPGTIMWKKFQAFSQVAQYVTQTYSSKPYAEVEDASCLRSGCHSTDTLKGKIISKQGIKFDHESHLMNEKKGLQLRCVTCHTQIVVGKHIDVTYAPCYLCHFKDRDNDRELQPLGGCLGCHEIPEESFSLGNMTYYHEEYVKKKGVSCDDCHLEVIKGNGNAPQGRCFACHNQPEKLVMHGDISFIHNNHVTKHKVACFHCHQEIHHGFEYELGKSNLADLDSFLMRSTGTKSDTKKERSPTLTFNCGQCHQDKHNGQLSIYSGKIESLDLPKMPSPMYLAHVDCVGCHYAESAESVNGDFNGKTFSASDKACVKCHDANFAGIWDETKEELQRTLSEFSEKIEDINIYLESSMMSETDTNKVFKKLEKVESWHNFVLKSRGEHNIYLASWIIRQEDMILTEIIDELEIESEDLSKLPLVSGRYCNTLCHTKVGIKQKMKVNVFGKEMSHMMHSILINCTQCHEIGNHKEIPLKEDLQETVCESVKNFV